VAIAQRITEDSPRWYWPLPTDLPIYLTRWHNVLYTGVPATWVATLEAIDFDNAAAVIASQGTSSQTATKMYHYTDTLGIVVDGTGGNVAPSDTALAIWYDKQSGDVSSFWGGTKVEYRLIAT
jgi:hypothetical protein